MRALGPAALALVVFLPATGQAGLVGADAGRESARAEAISQEDTSRLLARGGGGRAVVDRLGANLAEAAARNDLAPAQLRSLLLQDATALLGTDGRLMFAEPGLNDTDDRQGETAEEGRAAAASMDLPETSQAFLLHSQPPGQRNRTIYIDFDGYTLPASSWWVTSAPNKLTAGAYPGLNLDGAANNFSEAERTYIVKAWQVIAERYAPFDVDVTTEEPPAGALDGGDSTWGVRVVFTDSATAATTVCGGCAGTAMLDVFDAASANFEPVWTFRTELEDDAPDPAKGAYISTHEIGHTLALVHDGAGTGTGATGTPNARYYGGVTNLWVPVMGIGNWHALQQFSKGEYTGAKNLASGDVTIPLQDDLAVIAASGAPMDTDDYGNNATSPTPAGTTFPATFDGVISQETDDDTFSFTTDCVGPITATAEGIGQGQSLDIEVSILNAAGNSALATNNPGAGSSFLPGVWLPSGVDASATVNNAAVGTYRVRVDGVGFANPASTGYSAYGSVGMYELEIDACHSGVVATVPGPPASASASPNARTTTGQVSWTAPSSDGGSAITGYTITGLPGGTVNVGNVLTYAAAGLVPGTTYTVNVFAKNAVGTSATAASTTLKVDTWAPTTKPVLTANLSGATASLSWTAPANPGGATLTGWKVIGTGATPVNETLPAGTLAKDYSVNYGTTTYTVTGVYTATDLAGIQASDSKSVNRVPGAPGPPASASASPNPRTTTGTVNWTAPSSDGGSAITGYLITGLPGGSVEVGNVLTHAATNLVPGTTYTVNVFAKNINGTSASAATTTLKVDTWAPTTKPVLTATLSGATASLSWTAPANPGGATLTGWNVVGTGASAVNETLPPGTLAKDYSVNYGTTTYTVTGVYTATDIAGVQASDAKSVNRPTTVPGAPASANASPNARTTTGTVNWTAPSSSGGSAITGYRITGLPGSPIDVGTVLTYAATNLTPGTVYTVEVFARNLNGTSATSAATTLKVDTWAPTTKPLLTANLSGDLANLTWTAPANPGGAVLTGWRVIGTGASPSDEILPTAPLAKNYPVDYGTTSYTVTGVYTATDLAGIQASDSKSVNRLTTLPGAPASASASPNPRTTTGTVNWTAPSSSGGSAITGYRITGLPGSPIDVGTVLTYNATNLVPGTTYTVTVFAKNSVGTSSSGATTTLKVDTWAPTAKPVLTANLSGGAASLSWTAPANPGGATLAGWHVVGTGASPVDETVAAGTLSKDYPVTYGTTTYTVTGVYTATDLAGIQASDSKSVTRNPTAPAAPGSANATPNPRTTTGTVTWTAPTSDGGSAITGYLVTGLPSGPLDLGNVLTHTATDLVPGTTYTVNVFAKNAAGTSASPATTTLKVDTWAPTAKPVLSAVLSGTSANLSWTAPANPGGATLTNWRVVGTGASPVDEIVPAGTLARTYPVAVGTTTYTVTGIYTATDLAGIQASDSTSVTRTPDAPDTPGAPASVTTTPAVRGFTGTVSWTAPVDDGGNTITNYRITGLPGGTVDVGNVLSYEASGLVPGTTYNLTITAENAVGFGDPLATTLRVATWAPTEAPTLVVTLSGTTATLTFSAPPEPGITTLTGWRIDRTGPGTSPADKTVATSPTTMAGLSPGTHTFTVRPIYTADDITGVQTSAPASVKVVTKPSAPRIGTASNGAAGRPINATARWTPPTSTGNSAITGYRVYAYKLNSRNQIISTKYSAKKAASARSFAYPLAAGRYKFRVVAYNIKGVSAYSAFSRIVTAR